MENLKTILIIYLIIMYIIFTISLYFILNKTDEKRIFGLIPIVNLFYYFKIIKIEWYYLIIPFVNIVFLISSPYKLGYEFNQSERSKTFGFFFPIIYFPYIAFSDCKYLRKKRNNLNLTSINDIDKLENKIKDDCNTENEKKSIIKIKEKKKNLETNKIHDFINNIENISYEDEYITDEEITKTENNVTKNEFENKVIEISDGIYEIDESIADYNSIDNIDRIDELNIENNTDVLDKTEYKENKVETLEIEDIVFNNKTDEKKTELNKEFKCPNCNTLLIGSHKICPGCNKNIEDIMNI